MKQAKLEDSDIDIWYFDNPMMHQDWHEAEAAGLVYAFYLDSGNDYWDHSLVFCKPEDKEAVEKHYDENSY